MASTTETKETQHWAWRDPNRPRWLLIGIKSDWWNPNHSANQVDEADHHSWCRSSSSRNLRRCTSEADAHRRTDMVRVLWQDQLNEKRKELDRCMDSWAQDLADLASPPLPPKAYFGHRPRSTKEGIDQSWREEVNRIKKDIRTFERYLAMQFQLCKVSTRVETTTDIEEIP
jgi:hypothetical protein